MTDEIIKEQMLRNLKKSVNEMWGDNENEEVLRDIYLTNQDGKSFPEEYLGEEIMVDIQNKFYYFLDAIINEVNEEIEIVIEPYYDDIARCFVIWNDHVILRFYRKAWKWWYSSEEEMMDDMYMTYLKILEHVEYSSDIEKKLFSTLEKEGYKHYVGDKEYEGDYHYFNKDDDLIAIVITKNADRDMIDEVKSVYGD